MDIGVGAVSKVSAMAPVIVLASRSDLESGSCGRKNDFLHFGGDPRILLPACESGRNLSLRVIVLRTNPPWQSKCHRI
jgi:hypothetical protein